MSKFYNDSIFWIEVEKIKPNPYQPRTEFDEAKLKDLASSIRQYGVLQPLVVTRKEIVKEDGITSEYELIAGERRLRASKMAGLLQVPVIIRSSEEDSRVKLELAIIENLQREDLNPIDRAIAFGRLAEEFNFKHAQIAEKVGKSREYVTNTIRLLMLPEDMKNALAGGSISEGHTRPLLMLIDRPEEQSTLFKEIIHKKLTVREAEGIARRIAYDRVRKKERAITPDIVEIEGKLSESFGTRVLVEPKDVGGKITIEFFSDDDLRHLLDVLDKVSKEGQNGGMKDVAKEKVVAEEILDTKQEVAVEDSAPVDDRSGDEKKEQEDEDLYGLDKFSI
ncbi:MAG: ParB/RepB/Spo0J family partition protein [Patescibacteria group bacterium]